MQSRIWIKPFQAGAIGGFALLAVYFVILTLVSGWGFAREQFLAFWYFVVALAAGFAIQIALFIYLRQITRHADASAKVVAVSGATSTGAMIACCTHYLANVLPVLATAAAGLGWRSGRGTPPQRCTAISAAARFTQVA